jgi:hypothetical protein
MDPVKNNTTNKMDFDEIKTYIKKNIIKYGILIITGLLIGMIFFGVERTNKLVDYSYQKGIKDPNFIQEKLIQLLRQKYPTKALKIEKMSNEGEKFKQFSNDKK